MKIGLQIYYFEWPGGPHAIGPRLSEIARTAERAGFYSLWVMDHFFQLGGGFGPPQLTRIEGPMLEGYTTMAYLAAITEKLKLGLMVTGNVYRHPGILIKTVTTLDVLSGGRAYLGIGSGWNEYEARGLGVPFPGSTRDLVGRLEETLQIAKRMWKGDASPFAGRYYQLEQPLNSPEPLSKPHPPILVGMWKGGPRMLQLTARYADACNLQIGTSLPDFPAEIRERYSDHEAFLRAKLEQLERYCDEIGRSYKEIELTVLATIKIAKRSMNPSAVVELCHRLAQQGISHVIFNMPNVHEIEPLEVIGSDVIPHVEEV